MSIDTDLTAHTTASIQTSIPALRLTVKAPPKTLHNLCRLIVASGFELGFFQATPVTPTLRMG